MFALTIVSATRGKYFRFDRAQSVQSPWVIKSTTGRDLGWLGRRRLVVAGR